MDFIDVFETDALPVMGGSSGTMCSMAYLTPVLTVFPTWESIVLILVSVVIMGVVGGVIGYMVKIILDRWFRKFNKRK